MSPYTMVEFMFRLAKKINTVVSTFSKNKQKSIVNVNSTDDIIGVKFSVKC